MKVCIDTLPEGLKAWLDALSFTALIGTLASMLPSMATLLTVIWTALRVYEMETVQRLLKRRGTDDGS